ncbi:MAG: hypothetical protein ACOVLK_08640 [Terrimicrobiaceae bacterium]
MFLAETQKLTVEGNVHILREAVDEAIDLRERGAALENQMASKLRQGKEHIQRFADPVVLLQNRRSQAALLGSRIQQFQPLARL